MVLKSLPYQGIARRALQNIINPTEFDNDLIVITSSGETGEQKLTPWVYSATWNTSQLNLPLIRKTLTGFKKCKKK